MRTTLSHWRALLCGALACLACLSNAQELRIGLSSNPSSVDPHFVNNDAISAVVSHAYEPLVALDADARLTPALATSWRAINDTTWEFRLRDGVTFHDGATLDANDVVLSYVVQWDAAHPLHVGRDGSFAYFPGLFGAFLNAPAE